MRHNGHNVPDADELRWWISCADQHGRQQRITVLVLGDRVAVVLPPGDILMFEPDEVDDFADLLDRAGGFAAV